MKLTYLGTGTVRVEGAGEVSHGEVLDITEATATALLAEQPGNWSKAGTAGKVWVKEAPPAGAADEHDEPRTRRGR